MASNRPVPPQGPESREAEACLIGCCLLGGQDAVALVMDKARSASDSLAFFTDPKLKTFWSFLIGLYEANKPIDLNTVFLEIAKHRDSQITELTELIDKVPSAANLPYYLDQVVEFTERRRLYCLARELAEGAIELKQAPSKTIELIESKLSGPAVDGEVRQSSAKEATLNALGAIDHQVQHRGQLSGLTSGMVDLDKITWGIQRKELTIVAARPSQGKSALLINIAEVNGVDHKLPTLFFTLEMTAEAMVKRMMASKGRIDSQRLRSGDLLQKDYAAITAASSSIAASPIEFFDGELSIGDIRRITRRWVRTHGPPAIIMVDYLQKVRSVNSNEKKTYEVGEVSSGLKQMAKDYDVPVVAAVQLNRECDKDKGRRPKLSDCGDSGQIERDADLAILLYKATEQDPRVPSLKYELIVAKQREGSIGIVPALFFPAYTRFQSVSRTAPDLY